MSTQRVGGPCPVDLDPGLSLGKLVRTLGRHLRERFGERVHKVALDTGSTCPNRDGTLGRGGCTFCDNASFVPSHARIPLEEQIGRGAQVVARRTGARRQLAYFQAYTATWGRPLTELRELWERALRVDGVVGISVGTRPDCLGPGVLEALARLRDKGSEVWLELGLQSANDETLRRIRRGHDAACYFEAARRARLLGLPVCCHLIAGLPGEGRDDLLSTHHLVVEGGVDGLKIHPLHIVRGSVLAQSWKRGDVNVPTIDQYASWTADLVERTPPSVVFHRLTGSCSSDLLLAPSWCAGKWAALNAIEGELRNRGTRQGSGHKAPAVFSRFETPRSEAGCSSL